jgi:predicted enzyme involved in methoxymalonyl-ACP biosynthesis
MVDIAHLPWLPEAPGTFRAQLKALHGTEADFWDRIGALAGYRLDSDQLLALHKTARRGSERARKPLRLALISNATSSLIGPAIAATSYRYGLSVELTEPPYGQIYQSVLDSESELYSAKPDVVLLALDHRAFDLGQDFSGEAGAARKAGRAIEEVAMLSNAIHKLSAVCAGTIR